MPRCLLHLADAGLTKDIVQSRDTLEYMISNQRDRQLEWGWKDNAIALMALQVNDPNWCLRSVENQRSVDRMQISLLAVLSRLVTFRTNTTLCVCHYTCVCLTSPSKTQ